MSMIAMVLLIWIKLRGTSMVTLRLERLRNNTVESTELGSEM